MKTTTGKKSKERERQRQKEENTETHSFIFPHSQIYMDQTHDNECIIYVRVGGDDGQFSVDTLVIACFFFFFFQYSALYSDFFPLTQSLLSRVHFYFDAFRFSHKRTEREKNVFFSLTIVHLLCHSMGANACTDIKKNEIFFISWLKLVS